MSYLMVARGIKQLRSVEMVPIFVFVKIFVFNCVRIQCKGRQLHNLHGVILYPNVCIRCMTCFILLAMRGGVAAEVIRLFC